MTSFRRNFYPLPSSRNPWFLLPTDDAGPFRYFVLHLLSSRFKRKRLVIEMIRLIVRAGGYRLWPLVAPWLLRIVEWKERNHVR